MEDYEPKNVVVNYKTFKVHVRVGGKLFHIVDVMGNAMALWIDSSHAAGQGVMEAVAEVIDDFAL